MKFARQLTRSISTPCLIVGTSLVFSMAPVSAQTCDLVHELGTGWVRLISFDGSVSVLTRSFFSGPVRVADGEPAVRMGSLGVICNLNDMSRDGEYVVGTSSGVGSGSPERACRWDADGDLQDLGTLGGSEARAYAISADGSVVVGAARDASGQWRAFRWDAVGGMQALPIAGTSTLAADISADGTVIVGTSTVGSFPNSVSEMWRWTQPGGVHYLGTFQGDSTGARHVSADGAVILGTASESSARSILRWTAAGGYEEIQGFSSATIDVAGISTDGSTIAFSRLDFNAESFVWRAGVGLRQISSLGDDYIKGLSEDGTVGVGTSVVTSPTERFGTVWNLESLSAFPQSENFRAAGGLDTSFDAISGDGSVAGGYYIPPGFSPTAILTPLSLAIAERYCGPAVPNSTGCGAYVSAHGSGDATISDLRLSAGSLPAGSAGYFLTSMVQGSVFPVPGSEGRLCLGGDIGRIVGPGQVFVAGVSGRASLQLASNVFPTPGGAATVMAGDTWNFQGWYRDANPIATSNFTDAVSVTFR